MTHTLVFGGRRWFDQKVMDKILDRYNAIHRPKSIHLAPMQKRGKPGELYGADFHAAVWAEELGIPVHVHWAPWHLFGGHASGIRLNKMFTEHEIQRAIAFPGGRGTLNVASRLDHFMVPCDTYDMIVPLDQLDDLEKERRREEAERLARPRLPSAVEQVVEFVGKHAMERGSVLYVPPHQGKRPVLTESDKFILWHLHEAKCPFCKNWHWPGTRHRRMSVADSEVFDEKINERYAIELAEVGKMRKKEEKEVGREPEGPAPPPEPPSMPSIWDQFR